MYLVLDTYYALKSPRLIYPLFICKIQHFRQWKERICSYMNTMDFSDDFERIIICNLILTCLQSINWFFCNYFFNYTIFRWLIIFLLMTKKCSSFLWDNWFVCTWYVFFLYIQMHNIVFHKRPNKTNVSVKTKIVYMIKTSNTTRCNLKCICILIFYSSLNAMNNQYYNCRICRLREYL